MKLETTIEGLELPPVVEPRASLIGSIIDRREHFFYADQGYEEAKQLMEDLELDRLPLVDRQLQVIAVLDRGDSDPLELYRALTIARSHQIAT